jgi:hypothetical protein
LVDKPKGAYYEIAIIIHDLMGWLSDFGL